MNSETKKLRILVVEDEALVAMLMEDTLEELGHEVSAVASRLHDARELARTGDFDLAILDVNLDGRPSYPIAQALKERGIPFAFATGYGNKGLDQSFVGIPTLAKPFVGDDVARLIREMSGT